MSCMSLCIKALLNVSNVGQNQKLTICNVQYIQREIIWCLTQYKVPILTMALPLAQRNTLSRCNALHLHKYEYIFNEDTHTHAALRVMINSQAPAHSHMQSVMCSVYDTQQPINECYSSSFILHYTYSKSISYRIRSLFSIYNHPCALGLAKYSEFSSQKNKIT